MSSQVRYRFKNAVAEDSVAFEGAVITIGDVKRLIAAKRGLGPEGAAELTLFDPQSGEEHDDDARVIPRNSLVLVKRAPSARFKPLQSGTGGGVAAAPPPLPIAPGPQQQQGAAPAPAPADEFGGDYYSEQPVAAVVAEAEDRALASRLQATASSWHREVRQGAMRGRGRGRGPGGQGVPFDYHCPRCAVPCAVCCLFGAGSTCCGSVRACYAQACCIGLLHAPELVHAAAPS